MAIYRKKTTGIWYYSVYVPGRATRMRGSCGTKNRAEAEIIEKTLRLASGRKTPKQRVISLIEALYGDDDQDDVAFQALPFELDRIVEMTGKQVSASTAMRKRQDIDRLAAWCAENWPSAVSFRTVNRVCAQEFARSLAKAGLSQKSRYNLIGELGAIWNTLKRAHDHVENPWPSAMPAENGSGRGSAFSKEEAERIFAAADRVGHGWGLACRIAASTGLRYGDIANLTYADIIDGAIRIRPSKTDRHGIGVCVPLPPDILAMIPPQGADAHILPRHAHYYATYGQYMPFKFFRVLDAAGVDKNKYTFHSFRHYFRTRLAAAGVSDETAMRLGGWTQKTTAARYDHADHLEELAAAVNAAWNVTSSPS